MLRYCNTEYIVVYVSRFLRYTNVTYRSFMDFLLFGNSVMKSVGHELPLSIITSIADNC